MKSIAEYLDYRAYMRDFYEECKKTSAFSWREFSKQSGFTSSGYLKLVCDGKTRLRRTGSERVARAMGLTGFQVEYFCCMVKFCDAQSDDKKLAAYREMRSLAESNQVRILGDDAYSFFSSWINPALRELAPIIPGAKPLDMARMLVPSVPAADVRYALDLMVKLNILKRTDEGGVISYQQLDVGINAVYNADLKAAVNVAMRTLQKQFAKMAVYAMDEASPGGSDLSGITMGIDCDAYERIEKEIVEFRKKIESIASDVKNYDRVYRMNLQLFPLSRGLEEFNEGR